ncbi:hypothetical protein [Paenibacillus guangzhouensis]|uniref:hypothetical protein n=1 Tax=Paenibacillus guangzhouensis TaxID=1473112 RepID=UPI00187B7DC6|nr:hypothetical protein [Paenibacillus guangzhouensis]
MIYPCEKTEGLYESDTRSVKGVANCFDLAIWLMEEFRESGISAYATGHDLHTPHAHVAVVAINEEGHKYFWDLGDQWIDPILIERDNEDYCEDALDGFVTEGKIRVEASPSTVNFNYIRPNGKVSQQKFDLQPIQREELLMWSGRIELGSWTIISIRASVNRSG